MPDAIPDLDALVEAARLAHAAQRNDDAAAARVLHMLAEADGSLPVDTLLRQGVPRDLVAHVVAQDPNDKRKKQRARLGIIGDTPVVWLTSTGWQATGRSSGREAVPTSDSVAHATAPSHVGAWLDARQQRLLAHGIRMTVTWGAACRRWSNEVQARAWGTLRLATDREGAVGSLTGGLIPDGLILQHLPTNEQGEALYAQLHGERPGDPDDLAESTFALEIEDNRKSSSGLRHKVDRWEAATLQLHAAKAVLWVVKTREVARRLRDLGVDSTRRPTQLLVPATALGLPGEDLGHIERPWWPLQVPPDAPQ
ncbi:hypothetical protein [Motilibacter aurantiacus]|uniref:hypothetical protein n=1 Tax=Motilibacter aurantiacus TaxID=2714955 RepID=UPI00140E7424|nr:hypothetical protein [Motilibacter aurantiacus]NHC44625.1 hypothetical protein [Motilibacter aurantiacus]